jgi:superfamily II DNA/RNA helicase
MHISTHTTLHSQCVEVLSRSHTPQGERAAASAGFRAADRGILLTSDVSARGVDYPDVTLVIQVIYIYIYYRMD